MTPTDGNAPTSDLAERYWDRLLELEPVLATAVGDERFDHLLPDVTEAGRAKAAVAHEAALSEAAGVDRDAVGAIERTTLDVVQAIAQRAMSDLRQRTDRLVVANQMVGPVTLIGELSSLQRADTAERLDRYLERLRAIPRYLEGCAEVAREGIATGVVSPNVVAERATHMVERLLEAGVDGSPALQPAGDDADARDRVAEVVRTSVNPAYDRYLETLRGYLPHATDSIGVSALPDGEAIYDAQILAWTTVPMSAREIHDVGTERFERIQEERFTVAGTLGHDDPNEAIAARNASGENTPASAEALIALAEDQVRRSWEAAPAYFGVLPSENCVVKRVPEFMEADTPGAYYFPPTEDRSRPGTYFINCSDLEHGSLHQLASVTYHEANPGHHFQVAIEQELEGLPRIRRFGGILAGSAFVEGWGLYSERLADEMGLYLDDWERLGMLDAQAWRAARLITDTGIHALGWDRDRAIAKLMEGGVMRRDAEVEVDRYIGLPGQALSYMIGMMEIERARASMAERLADAFHVRDFHDRILTLGQLPLPALRREMEDGPTG